MKSIIFQVILPSEKYQMPSQSNYDEYSRHGRRREKKGISGYDPEEPDMRGVFMARGPGMIIYPQLEFESG